jgi:hypothetical protein
VLVGKLAMRFRGRTISGGLRSQVAAEQEQSRAAKSKAEQLGAAECLAPAWQIRGFVVVEKSRRRSRNYRCVSTRAAAAQHQVSCGPAGFSPLVLRSYANLQRFCDSVSAILPLHRTVPCARVMLCIV